MRKTKTNIDILKKRMINALEKSLGVVTVAARNAGISRMQHYDWLKEDPEYKKSVDDVEGVAIDFAESKLHQAINKGSDAATIFYLKTKGKKRGYIERQEIENSGDMGLKIVIEKTYEAKPKANKSD